MSNNVRIIPRLDIKGPNLVKGIHLEGLRVLGNPEEFARFYYENGADELLLQDVVASLLERNSLDEIISKIAKEIFIPLTVGGGLRTIEDIQRVLRCGADKVAINTGAIKNPNFIREAANKFGSSTIAVAIEAIKQPDGKYFAFIDNGREVTNIEATSWSIRVAELGAGELIVTSVDREGTGLGYDIELTKQISELVSVPVIAHGGAGKLNDFVDIIKNGSADAVAVASMLHYDTISNQNFQTPSNKNEGNIDFLKSGKNSFAKIEVTDIFNIKMNLLEHKINCRK